eukprot:CAMPEP_0204381022 /NCGR_PEP_ID=MMETSP0469-20131031/53868_1 /ASSEMBLY_ACC=CAM_ASM_000384 /TAXON_ID=2969 /ORGANISM="Oxyrrhis marina" /LENGTH=49 /DNA_ID= /DNA_START= /DNA_END= /DNA_ORIENTATION=
MTTPRAAKHLEKWGQQDDNAPTTSTETLKDILNQWYRQCGNTTVETRSS